jgi:RND superfamily putative drug exporter
MIVLCGRWVFWPFVPRFSASLAADETDRDTRQHRLWRGIAGGVARRPRTIWVGTALALAALTAGISNLSLGLPGDESFTKEVGSVTGQHLIEAHFPGGVAAPAEILARAATADLVGAAARAVPGVADLQPAEVSANGQWARVRAVLTDPPESRAALRTVQTLRETVHAVPGAEALVAGQTAANLDNEQATNHDNWTVMPLILGVVLVVLMLLLRAVVAPLLLLASVVLSYLAALGAAGLVLDAVGHPRLWDALPLQTFLFLVALGVDYTIFLMTRAREEVARFGHAQGVLRALTVTGGVITSAGVVLAATFAALGVLPLVPSLQTAVIVAVGVLLDTVLVRTLLVPALSLDIGRRTWWPGRLSQATATRVPMVDRSAQPARTS